MKRIIVFLSFLLIANVCLAAQWEKLAEKFYFNTESYKYDKETGYAYGWFKQENPGYWKDFAENKPREYSMTYFVVDCVNKRKAVMVLLFYSKEQELLENFDRATRPKLWSLVVPDTEEELVYNRLCNCK